MKAKDTLERLSGMLPEGSYALAIISVSRDGEYQLIAFDMPQIATAIRSIATCYDKRQTLQ